MFLQYNNLDITFQIDSARFRTLNIAYEHLHRIIPSHSHGDNSYEIHYVSSGKGVVNIEGKPYYITPNTLYMVGPHVAHAQISLPEQPMVDYCIYLRMMKPGGHRQAPGSIADFFIQQTFWIGQDSFQIADTLESMFQELKEKKLGYTTYVEILLQQLIVQMVRNYQNGRNARHHFKPATLLEAQDFIIEESFLYEYPTLTLEDLSARLGLSSRQTERLMLETYGKTFLQKRADARISAAEILLTYTERSISDIAQEVGYSSSEHFSNAFRKYRQISPREFRKNRNS